MLGYIVTAVGFFVVGAVFGALNEGGVERAIARLKAAEAGAQSTLDKITNHKAS